MIDWTSWMDYGFMKMALAAILIITPLFRNPDHVRSE